MTSVEKKIGDHRAGRGGVKCPCCGPSLGKDRKRFRRAMKRGPVREHVRRDIIEQKEEP